jgi:hypothetical protein
MTTIDEFRSLHEAGHAVWSTADIGQTRFPLGELVAISPGARLVLLLSCGDFCRYLARHACCDFGDVDAHSLQLNEFAIREGRGEIMSRFWINCVWMSRVPLLVLTELHPGRAGTGLQVEAEW